MLQRKNIDEISNMDAAAKTSRTSPNTERQQDKTLAKRRSETSTPSYQKSIPSISLPKGGGAIKGIDEKFTVNPATGTASLSVPIFASPSRSDFYPKLSLNYDSGAGNGPFGLGWNIDIPSITRKTDKGIPKYQDAEESDTFILSGAEDLVPSLKQDERENWVKDNYELTVDGINYFVQRYRPRTEGLFARIEKWQNKKTGQFYWRSISKDNVVSIYGKNENARIVDPDDCLKVFEWLIEESYDDKGNVIQYEYKKEDDQNIDPLKPQEKNRLANQKSYANRYIKKIKYGNRYPKQRDNWLFYLVFDYGEHDQRNPKIDPDENKKWPARQDAFSLFRSGFEIRTQRLCQRVLMFHHFPKYQQEQGLGEEPFLVRSTDFTFKTGPVLTYLLSIKQTGYIKNKNGEGYSSKSLPPLEFSYINTEQKLFDEIKTIDSDSLANLPMGVDGAQYQWVDLDGEGISGILAETSDAWYYKQNLGDAHFGPLRVVASKPSLGNLAVGQAQFMDLAGDGQLDLALLEGPIPGFYERTDEETWENFIPFKSLPNINWNDPNLRMIDLNGDGHTDIFITEDEVFVWYPSKAEEGFDRAEYVRKAFDEEKGPALVFADGTQSIYLADMTGDGLSDIVRIQNGNVCYWPNLGYGRFGAKVTMEKAPNFDRPDQFDHRNVRLADIDGTGTTDILYLRWDRVSIWFNQAGNSWSDERTITTLPVIDDLTSVNVFDLMGNGTACLIWSSPLPWNKGNQMQYIDLMGGKKPHLLEYIKNNMGKETALEYAPSTKFYLEDKAAGTPWITRLPFPVHVIEKVETHEWVTGTKLVNRYKYHHGYFDGKDREFRGFGMVEQFDTETFSEFKKKGLIEGEAANLDETLHSIPVKIRTWFHTGAYLKEKKISRHYEDEYYRFDDQKWLLDDTVIEEDLTTDELHEACRALKGLMLRQEIYATEGENSEHPYRTTEQNYQLKRMQPMGVNKHAVFFAHPRETLEYHYEQHEDDPRITHQMILEIDDFGNEKKTATIAYPRRIPKEPEQQESLITYSEAEFINKHDLDPKNALQYFYRVGVPCETRIFEMKLSALVGRSFGYKDVKAFAAAAAMIRFDEALNPDESKKRLIECTRIIYKKNDQTQKLALGELESLALPYETYEMAFTPQLIAKIYPAEVDENLLKNEAKYVQGRDIHISGDFRDESWWIPSGKQYFESKKFYLPTEITDPFGEKYITTYDDYSLLIIETKDPVENKVLAKNNYRTLLPWLITDLNNNYSGVRFNELGMVIASAVMGKKLNGDWEGDKLDISTAESSSNDDPTTKLEYHLEYKDNQSPIYVHTKTREKHKDLATRWQLSYTYSDGLGRQVLTKLLAEPGETPKLVDGKFIDEPGVIIDPRWVGTGRTVYDNKGNPVKQYEPYFSRTHEYVQEEYLKDWGVTPIMHYDPLGRLIKTDHPDGTISKVEFDSWLEKHFDQNDTVLESQWYNDRGKQNPAAPQPTNPKKRAAWLAAQHANTPTIIHLDVLGRPVLSIEYKSANVQYETRTKLDIQGNALTVIDALGRDAMITDYDMQGNVLRTTSIDSGVRTILENVAGNPIRSWDSENHTIKTNYDKLQRVTHVYVITNESTILAERLIYGDESGITDSVDKNLRGAVYLHYDGAGVLKNEQYDFKSNLKRSSRRLAARPDIVPDWTTIESFDQAVRIVDEAHALLDNEKFTIVTEYDALNRPEITTQFHNAYSSADSGKQNRVQYIYNEAGLLNQIKVKHRESNTFNIFVRNIDYNEKGQRLKIEYGNQVVTDYDYDDKTFRLIKLKSTRSPQEGRKTTLQDIKYTYDPVGNITEIRDDAQQQIIYNGENVEPVGKYEYDAIYRLIKATGREHIGQNGGWQPDHHDFPIITAQHPNDPQAMRNYTETYEYDEVGNIEHMKHNAYNGNWTRYYTYQHDVAGNKINNRLETTRLPGDPATGPYNGIYEHDNNGNMTKMPHLEVMQWDHNDQLIRIKRVPENHIGLEAFYQYDAEGQRVRKYVIENSTIKERIYIGGFEIYRGPSENGYQLERETIHIMDDKQRIALVEIKTQDSKPGVVVPSVRIRFELNNHLQSSHIELDENADKITYEEYHPYGTTSYFAQTDRIEVSKKTYRYSGKERDEENGFNYNHVRYYASWLGRWINSDPFGLIDGLNTYCYVKNNSINRIDPMGTRSQDSKKEKIRLIYYGGCLKKGDFYTFQYAAKNIRKDYRNDTVELNPIESAKQIANRIERADDDSIKSLDIVSHSGQFNLNFANIPDRNRGFYTNWLAKQLVQIYYSVPEEKRKGGFLKILWNYLTRDSKKYPAYKFVEDSLKVSSINFNKFTQDAVIELHGCKAAANDIPFLDNIAEEFSEQLYRAGKKDAVVIAHLEKAEANIKGEKTKKEEQDFRYRVRVVYHAGKELFRTNQQGKITREMIDKNLQKKRENTGFFLKIWNFITSIFD